ncbi:hypothetical protein UFOVP140_30 [uncultured Caudovirales phage]|uniref:Uncharacterized protein n=1 Tax=uncultured Caudovirales phage TaxID=2100421 RepID=A0A6J5LJA7_9CAUD|nr:hypothetical protein UFOVP140_30 [uncultured Caudovirales phage]
MLHKFSAPAPGGLKLLGLATCQGNLLGQCVDVYQKVAGKFNGLASLVRCDAIKVMRGIVTKSTDSVRPFLKCGRNFVIACQAFNSCVKSYLIRAWIDVSSRHFESASGHHCGSVGIFSFLGIIDSLNKRFSDTFRAVLGGSYWLCARGNFEDGHVTLRVPRVARPVFRWAPVRLDVGHHGSRAMVAVKRQVVSIRTVCIRNATISESGPLCTAIGAIMCEGISHE